MRLLPALCFCVGASWIASKAVASEASCIADVQAETIALSAEAGFAEALDDRHCAFIQHSQAAKVAKANSYILAGAENAQLSSNLAARTWAQISDAVAQPGLTLVYASGFDDFVQRQQCQRQVKSERVKLVRGGGWALLEPSDRQRPAPISAAQAALYLSRNAWLIASPRAVKLKQLQQRYPQIVLTRSTKALSKFGADNLFIVGDFAWPATIPSNWFHVQADADAIAAALQQIKTPLADISKPLTRPCYVQ